MANPKSILDSKDANSSMKETSVFRHVEPWQQNKGSFFSHFWCDPRGKRMENAMDIAKIAASKDYISDYKNRLRGTEEVAYEIATIPFKPGAKGTKQQTSILAEMMKINRESNDDENIINAVMYQIEIMIDSLKMGVGDKSISIDEIKNQLRDDLGIVTDICKLLDNAIKKAKSLSDSYKNFPSLKGLKSGNNKTNDVLMVGALKELAQDWSMESTILKGRIYTTKFWESASPASSVSLAKEIMRILNLAVSNQTILSFVAFASGIVGRERIEKDAFRKRCGKSPYLES